MPSSKRKYYWDSCVFIAWLQDETRAPGEMEGIEEVVRQIDARQALLLTSVLTRTEVLECRLTDQARRRFELGLQRRSIQMIAQDHRVADRSHEIRNYYAQRSIKLSTPDCVHLATAVIYQADEFHTFDGAEDKPRRTKLIPLSGNVAGYPLIIRTPCADQPSLLSGLRPQRGLPGSPHGRVLRIRNEP